MINLKNDAKYFSPFEKLLWLSSAVLIIVSFCIFDRGSLSTPIASLIGVTSLIFSAKGNPIGQLLMIIFSVFYGIISLGCAYYGEVATYLGMTAPMALFALISWLKNPFKGRRSEVKVGSISRKEVGFMFLLSAAVTAVFYFILDAFGTANMLPSTLSVTTSFMAVYLTFRRNPFFALAYAANDIVLIILWTMAALEDISYLSVVICFIVFLVNDLYGFASWLRMGKRQSVCEKN